MYTSIAELTTDTPEQVLINLCNDNDDDLSSVDLENPQDPVVQRIAKAIEDAGDEIDGYLRSQYTLPLTAVPKRITKLCRIIAKYYLFSRRALDMPEDVASGYSMAVKELEKIQRGEFVLDIETANPSVPVPAEFRTNKTMSERVFTSQLLNGF